MRVDFEAVYLSVKETILADKEEEVPSRTTLSVSSRSYDSVKVAFYFVCSSIRIRTSTY